jgi:hypothetical protein
MTTFTRPWSTHDETALIADESPFVAWRQVEPVLDQFTDFDDLHRYLVSAASWRRPSGILSAVGRMAEADELNDLAARVYLDAFGAGSAMLAQALSIHTGRPFETCLAIAREELSAVAREASFHGETHAGATITSRTWARSFALVGKGRHTQLTGELNAWGARLMALFTSFAETFAGRAVFDRVMTRLAPLDEVLIAAAACGEGMTFPVACRERGIVVFAARRQIVSYHARRATVEAAATELRDELAGARDDLVAGDLDSETELHTEEVPWGDDDPV